MSKYTIIKNLCEIIKLYSITQLCKNIKLCEIILYQRCV